MNGRIHERYFSADGGVFRDRAYGLTLYLEGDRETNIWTAYRRGIFGREKKAFSMEAGDPLSGRLESMSLTAVGKYYVADARKTRAFKTPDPFGYCLRYVGVIAKKELVSNGCVPFPYGGPSRVLFLDVLNDSPGILEDFRKISEAFWTADAKGMASLTTSRHSLVYIKRLNVPGADGGRIRNGDVDE